MDLKRILFIDDDQYYLDAFKRLIKSEKLSWQVTTFSSALEALSKTDIDQFDVIITDLVMPEYDGFWVIEQLNNKPETKDIPVIVLTGDNSTGLKRKALQMGATDLLNKPIHPEDLFARINNSIRIKEYQDQLKKQNIILEYEVRKRTVQLELSQVEIIWKLARAAEFRDESTGKHVIRVGKYSQLIAQALGMSEKDCYQIFLTSPLHDIGKIGIPDQIILKRMSLTEGEMNEMKKHCEFGSKILLERSNQELETLHSISENFGFSFDTKTFANPFLTKAAEIAISHHENWDGSGYPFHKGGNEIPLSGRIVALADMFDALRSKRPYKSAFSQSQTRELILNASGKKLDPTLVKVFQKIESQMEGVLLKLTDGS
jgi:putative two-component system response regulator